MHPFQQQQQQPPRDWEQQQRGEPADRGRPGGLSGLAAGMDIDAPPPMRGPPGGPPRGPGPGPPLDGPPFDRRGPPPGRGGFDRGPPPRDEFDRGPPPRDEFDRGRGPAPGSRGGPPPFRDGPPRGPPGGSRYDDRGPPGPFRDGRGPPMGPPPFRDRGPPPYGRPGPPGPGYPISPGRRGDDRQAEVACIKMKSAGALFLVYSCFAPTTLPAPSTLLVRCLPKVEMDPSAALDLIAGWAAGGGPGHAHRNGSAAGRETGRRSRGSPGWAPAEPWHCIALGRCLAHPRLHGPTRTDCEIALLCF